MTNTIGDEYTSEQIARMIVEAAIGKKAIAPVIIDVRGACDYADFLVVCSGKTDRQVNAIATGIDGEVIDLRTCVSNEGLANGQWALLDYGDVVVHIFCGSKRNEYNIEGLWKDAPRIEVYVPPDLRLTDELYDDTELD
ncbi:MAG: ribosome silencing factor [Proteobacteria bacterium]|nr:ribosome silencing factor [Pseudomonadota bacterium]